MSEVHTEVHPDDEKLVAYLDSELSREQRDEIEERLVHDESLRSRLQSLQRTWDCLGLLPDITTDEQCVQTTLELVVKDLTGGVAPSEIAPAAGSSSVWFRWGAWVGVVAAVGVLAFLGARLVQQNQLARDVDDLPIAIDADAYAVGSDLEMIREIASIPHWQGMGAPSMLPDVDEILDQSRSGEASAQQVAGELEVIDPQQRLIVAARVERFNRLHDLERQTLRDNAANVAAQDDADRLLSTMRAYAKLREQISDETIKQIETGDRSTRHMALRAGVAEVMDAIGDVTAAQLSEETVERIYYTLLQIARIRLKSGDSAADAIAKFVMQRTRVGMDDPLIDQGIASWILSASAERVPVAGQPGTSSVSNRNRGLTSSSMLRDRITDMVKTKISPMRPNEFEMIEAMLPQEDYESLHNLVGDPWMRSIILQDWANTAFQRKTRGIASPRSLPERYLELPSGDRERIDLMSPELARKALIQAS